MPELPEVETTVRGIRPALLNHRIVDVWLDWPQGLATPDPEVFQARLKGQRIREVTRRAKYIIVTLEADSLLIHLKMTGRLYVVPDDSQQYADQWVHFRFQLDNGYQLRFSDSRKFGRVYLVDDPAIVTADLGPEPLDPAFTLEAFQRRLARRKGKIKPLLLNQSFVAGIGNIYADEALHLAGIHPIRSASTLSEDEIVALWQGIQSVLADGIAREGASVNWYRKPDGTKGQAQNGLRAYGQTGRLCQTCQQAAIEKIVIGQRGTHFCPNCQRETHYGR
ncbi:MAG: bifunctional DNA-formamidopyrimidine glycosylase/DNA-(apurinic or apyrimidinic site) lyase [Chloroflexi bacterium]|nr:bifunctional DNA-formamidopyrimidine glycosylase/DNA-(apurinic or apyrimidinic site) lyase [Chloroflexota bacterium]